MLGTRLWAHPFYRGLPNFEAGVWPVRLDGMALRVGRETCNRPGAGKIGKACKTSQQQYLSKSTIQNKAAESIVDGSPLKPPVGSGCAPGAGKGVCRPSWPGNLKNLNRYYGQFIKCPGEMFARPEALAGVEDRSRAGIRTAAATIQRCNRLFLVAWVVVGIDVVEL